MAWIVLTEDHVKARIAAAEWTAYVDAADVSGQVAGILLQVTGLVRSKAASCRENIGKMGPSGTIPDECLFAACTIARDALVGSLPLDEGASELRKEELRKAHSFLDSVAACDLRIEDASGALPEIASDATASVGGEALQSPW